MAYKTMVRYPKVKDYMNEEVAEASIDGYLKEGTDQGWALHSFTHGWSQETHVNWFTFIWETND